MTHHHRLLDRLVAAARAGKADAVLAILVPRLESAMARARVAVEYREPFERFRYDAHGRDDFEALAAATLAALTAWAEAGAPLEARVAAVGDLSGVLKSRILMQHLREAPELLADPAAVAAVAAEEMSVHRAHYEGVELCKALIGSDSPEAVATLLGALGEAPAPLEVAQRLTDGAMPPEWSRAHGWLVAFPKDRRGAWREPDAVLDARVGRAPADGRLIGDVTVSVGDGSPFSVDELAAMGPREAAEAIGAWVPPEGFFEAQTPRGLQREITQAVTRDPAGWASTPIETMSRLRHPVYIAGYFEGLTGGVQEVRDRAASLAAAVALTCSEPWPVGHINHAPLDTEHSWSEAKDAGLKLLQALWRADADMGDHACAARDAVLGAARDREVATAMLGADVDDITAALNRPFTRALDVAFAYADYLRRTIGELPADFIEILDESLALTGSDGAQARAILATRLPYLYGVAPSWFAGREPLLVGDEAPERLGVRTFECYLKWGQPHAGLLERLKPAFVRAARRGADRALGHVLLGMCWEVPGYSPGEVLDALAPAGAAVLSDAGETLARLVRTTDAGAAVDIAVEFWREALDRALAGEAYAGIGWMTDVSAVEEETWLQLTFDTCRAKAGSVEWGEQAAERAAQYPMEPRALEIVAELLDPDVPLWDLHRIANAGMRLLRGSQPLGPIDEQPARGRLREKLVERGYYDAREVD
jgi:hypothetical protein